MNMSQRFRAGIYIRLSREDEKEGESSSIESQREYLLSYLQNKGYHYAGEYVDDGYTGTQFERPSFKRLLGDIEVGNINMVVVKDLSRLGRNNSKVSYYLDEYFPIHRVRFIAINNDYDSYIQNASVEFAWLTNGMNENYCLDISKKVRSALKVRKEKGYFTGFKAPYGYLRSKEDPHKLIIDQEVVKVVKRIFKLAYTGKSPSQIADVLSLDSIPTPSDYAHLNRGKNHLWCARTIADMLTNETYIGNLTQGRRKKINYKIKKEVRVPKEEWIIKENTHEAIIDKNIFRTVQELLKNKSRKNSQNDYLFRGFLYCAECGHRMSITKSKDGKRAYIGCSYYRKYSKFHLCTPHTMNYYKLESLILETLKSRCKQMVDTEKIIVSVRKDSTFEKKKKEIEKEKKCIECEIKQSSQVIDRAYIDMRKNIIDLERYQRTTQKLKEEMEQYQESLKDLEERLVILNNKKEKDFIPKKVKNFLNLTDLKRNFLVQVFDKIYIREDKQIEIHYKFKDIVS